MGASQESALPFLGSNCIRCERLIGEPKLLVVRLFWMKTSCFSSTRVVMTLIATRIIYPIALEYSKWLEKKLPSWRIETLVFLHWKYLCVPACIYRERMLINFTKMSLCNTFAMQAILYQFKRDVAVRKRLGCPQCMQRTWWQIVATPYTGFRLVYPGQRYCHVKNLIGRSGYT